MYIPSDSEFWKVRLEVLREFVETRLKVHERIPSSGLWSALPRHVNVNVLIALNDDVGDKGEGLDCGRLGVVLLDKLKVRDASHDIRELLCH